jgi:hypothetical protein
LKDGLVFSFGGKMKPKLALVLLSALLASCANAALTATEAPAEPTATKLPPTEALTDTPHPTATADLASTAIAATETAKADAMIEIVQELETIGLSADEAELVYLQSEPMLLSLNEQALNGVVDETNDDSSYANFIMGVDIAWETKTGISGCGFVFRGEDDLMSGQQMQFVTIRLSGAPQWAIALARYGEPQAGLASGYNNIINSGQGDKNEYILVADGLSVTIFANGTRLGATTLPAARTEGRFGLIAWQDSGQTTCTFENMWVLEMSEE